MTTITTVMGQDDKHDGGSDDNDATTMTATTWQQWRRLPWPRHATQLDATSQWLPRLLPCGVTTRPRPWLWLWLDNHRWSPVHTRSGALASYDHMHGHKHCSVTMVNFACGIMIKGRIWRREPCLQFIFQLVPCERVSGLTSNDSTLREWQMFKLVCYYFGAQWGSIGASIWIENIAYCLWWWYLGWAP